MEISENTKPEHETTSSSYIPEWFLLEILYKLPSKSVFRFKCLSKQFLTHISETSFVRDYISRASSSSSAKALPWTLVTRTMLSADQADHKPCGERFDHFERNLFDSSHPESAPSISKHVTPCPSMKSCEVLSISNGLCLCSWVNNKNHRKSYSIFNPLTKQSIPLPAARTYVRDDSAMAFYACVDQVGVVSYKVAHLPLIRRTLQANHLAIKEFSSKTWRWTSFTAEFPEPMYRSFSTPFSFKGNFHWVDSVDRGSPRWLISYEPVRIIHCPGSGLIKWCGEIVSIGGEYNIRCIRKDFDQGFIYVWRLKDYEQGTWELDHKFSIREIQLPYADNKMMKCKYLFNIALNPSEPDVLYLWGKAKDEVEWMHVSFDVRSRKSRVNDTIPRICGYGTLKCFQSIPYVLPRWPAILPHPLFLNFL